MVKFEVHSSGDPSVGLWGVDAVVVFDDNLDWNADAVEEARCMLREFYDVELDNVFTEAEYDELMRLSGEYGG